MGEHTRFYCTLEPAGFAETCITAFQQKYSAVYDSWRDFAVKHGVEDFYCGRTMEGLKFDRDKVPLGWTSGSKLPANIYKPARSKVCMEAYKEMKALPSRIGMFELSAELRIGTVMSGMSVAGPAFETVGDQIILSLPEGSDVPEGATEMKTSEYWMLKEAAGDDNG